MATVNIEVTKKSGEKCSYIGSVSDDGYIYFNDNNFYRYKNGGSPETDCYIRSRTKYSWTKCNIFSSSSSSGNNPGGVVPAPGGEGVEKAIKWCVDIANNDEHGYTQELDKRNGPDYDCSSLLYNGFRIAGYNLPFPAGDTKSMIADFTAAGFTWIPGLGNDVTELKRGDILLNIVNHTELYLGDGRTVSANINEFGTVTGGQTGDQTGLEIAVGQWYPFPWDGVLRMEK